MFGITVMYLNLLPNIFQPLVTKSWMFKLVLGRLQKAQLQKIKGIKIMLIFKQRAAEALLTYSI